MNFFWKLRHPCTPKPLSTWILTQYRTALPTAQQEDHGLLTDEMYASAMIISSRYADNDLLQKRGSTIDQYIRSVLSVLDVLFLILLTEKDGTEEERRHLFVDTLRELIKAPRPYPPMLDRMKGKFCIIAQEIAQTQPPDSSANMVASLHEAGLPSHAVRAATDVAQRRFDTFKADLQRQLEYGVLCHPQDQAFPVPDDPNEFSLFVRSLINASVNPQR